jgi:hypothetical protein
MRRSFVLVSTVVLVGLVDLPPGASAQEATPAAGTPTVAEMVCSAEPRDIDELLALWFDEAGGPVATPTRAEPIAESAVRPAGPLLDDATIVAITEATRGWFYCIEIAGQHARGLSYVTDNIAAQLGPDLANPNQDSPEDVRAVLEGQLAAMPTPDPQLRMPNLAGPRKAQLLDDGRAAAVWSYGGNKLYFIYVEEGERWLIDEVIDIIDEADAPAEATPTG